MGDVKAGMYDPYWYESTVGLFYMVDMLNPDNHIKSVELQAFVELGLDDVVITHENGETKFIQVKYISVNNPLTFGNLINVKSYNGKNKVSLLGELAKSWIKEKGSILHER